MDLPDSIGNLNKLQKLKINNNKLIRSPKSIFNIIKIIYLDDSSYQIYNLDPECEYLLFNCISTSLTNLPTILKELWLSKKIDITKLVIKLPFNCEKIIF